MRNKWTCRKFVESISPVIEWGVDSTLWLVLEAHMIESTV